MQKAKVATYAASGTRIRAYSLDACLYLESLSLVLLKRNRRGEVVAAFFRPQDGANPLLATCNMGQRYSFLEVVSADGARTWSHKPLMQRQDLEALTGVGVDSPEDVDLYLRGVFRAVALSVMARPTVPSPQPTTPKSGVVDIGKYRRSKAATRRPIEFDSERRAA